MRLWFAFAALCLAACGSPSASPVARIAEALPQQAGEWMELTPRPTNIDGQVITATCSHFPGTDAAYRFWAKRGATNRLVVYFDGGGACWNDATCSAPYTIHSTESDDTFYKAELLPADDPREMHGIFDVGDARNPVRDWSFVFVPYCTGDVHTGSATTAYTNPQTHEQFSIQHRGADNFRVIMAWIRENFDAPEQILVTGSSAGAYGAVTHFSEVRDAYPSGRAMMLGDAGQGIITPDFVAVRNQTWNYQLPRGVSGAERAATNDTLARVAEHYPADRFAQYTSELDHTQIGFYGLMTRGNACREWTDEMTRDLTRRELRGNFRAYVAAGDSHTILRSPSFYTEQSGGMVFSQWLGAMLSSSGTGWDNRTCPECAAPQRACGH